MHAQEKRGALYDFFFGSNILYMHLQCYCLYVNALLVFFKYKYYNSIEALIMKPN